MRKFPFETTFSTILKPLVSSEKDKYLALASLEEVSKFIPNIDTNINVDLLPVAFNACVANRINKNGDGIDTKTALYIYKEFIYKPINVEHNRQKVIGTIITAGFSEFGSDIPLSEQQVSQINTPFNIVLGGIVWRIVSPDLADSVEDSSDPTSEKYLNISASWELGFSEYNLALLDGGKRNLSDAELITDPSKIEEIKNHLQILGGDGKYNDKFIFRIPKNDVLPLGIGFTEQPAAEVKGIATKNDDSVINIPATETFNNIKTEICKDTEQKTNSSSQHFINKCSCGNIISQCRCSSKDKIINIIDDGCSLCRKIIDSATEYKMKKNKISQIENYNVKIERNENMKIASIKDLTDETLKQANASDIASLVSDELKKGNEIWLTEKNKLSDTLAESKKNQEILAKDNTQLQEDMKQLKSQINTFIKANEDREKVEKFNSRMNELNELFDFDDETRAALVDDIKSIASDEDFAKWKTKASILLKGFAKKTKQVEDKTDKKCKDGCDDAVEGKKCKADDSGDDSDDSEAKKKAKASTTVIASVIENAKESGKNSITNTTTSNEISLKEKYQSAFAKENFVITKR